MGAGRRKARRDAVFALYQRDLLGVGRDKDLADPHDDPDEYSTTIVDGVRASLSEIDALLSSHLHGWSLGRLGVLERSILRVATYELVNQPMTPVAVVVDEAVGLAKRYCSAEAGSLVNGILSGVAAAARPAECANEAATQPEQR